MSIRFACPHCFVRLSAPAGSAGQTVRCPKCSSEMSLPGPQPVGASDLRTESPESGWGRAPRHNHASDRPERQNRSGAKGDWGKRQKQRGDGTYGLASLVVALIAGLLVGLVGGGLGVWAWIGSRPKEVVEVVEEVPARPVDQAAPPAAGNEKADAPAQPAPWIPRPGDDCSLYIPAKFTMRGWDGKDLCLVAPDVFALDRMVKYVNARDGKGLSDMIDQGRLLWSDRPEHFVKVIAVNREVGTAEVRLRDTINRGDRQSPSRARAPEVVVFIEQLRR